jgi:nucleolar GTP-binding protein
MEFYTVPTPQKLIDDAFSYARKQGPVKKKRKSVIQHRKMKVSLKMKSFAEYLEKHLKRMEQSVPKFDKLHPFYQELLPDTLQIVKVKQSVSQMVSVRKLIKKQLIIANKNLHKETPDALEHMRKASARYFGRVSSIIYSLEKSLHILQEANRVVKEVPEIRTDIPTLILAGYPNTGKTTILKRLTKSKAQVASYPFTTKSLQLGYFSIKYHEIQVMDTPGLLDRHEAKRNKIERKALAALRHLATAVLFVADPTASAGYPVKKQKALLEKLQEQFSVPFVIVLNKTDIASEEEIEKAQKQFGFETIKEGKNVKSKLQENLWKAMGFSRFKHHL